MAALQAEEEQMASASGHNWRDHGVKIIPSAQLDLNTAQTPGMTRAAAVHPRAHRCQ